MNFHVVTIFPEIFEKYFQVGVVGRAQETGKIKVKGDIGAAQKLKQLMQSGKATRTFYSEIIDAQRY